MKSSIFFKKIESFLKQNLQKIKKIATVAMAFFLTSIGIRTLAEENKVDNIVKDDSKSQKLEIKEGSFAGQVIIEINKPNEKGVSHNIYNKFDMTSDDSTIFNNTDKNTAEEYESKLSGIPLTQNPNFNEGVGAKVIINEIVGGGPSNLAGNVEVAGKKADLIFANENGIKVNDQKYYNVKSVIFGNSIKAIEDQKEHSHPITNDGQSISVNIEKIKEKIKDIKEKIEKEKIKDINKNIEEMEKRIKISKKESEIIKSLEKELKKEIKNLEIAKASARTANPSMYENKIIIKPSSKDGYSSLYSLQRVNAKTLEIDKKTGAIASRGQDDLSLPVVYGQRIDSASLPTMASTKTAQDASNQIKYISKTQKTDGINFNKSKDDLSLDDASFADILPVALTMVSPAETTKKTAKQTKDTQESDTAETKSIKIKSSNGSAKNGIKFKKGEAGTSTTEDFTPVSLASAATVEKTDKAKEQLDNTQLSDEAKTVKKAKVGNDSSENTLEFKAAEVATSAAQKLIPVSVSSETNTEKLNTPIKKLNHIEVADTTKTQLEKVEGHDKSTLVQIAKTNSNGISHNLYNEFSIESDENVLLNNNSGGKVGSKLLNGQQFSSNKNLDGKSASLIINEVGMNDRGATKLAGGLEVLGTKSDVIIANENGIIVNGGRFENVGELTLSSGKYRMSDSSGKQHAFSDNNGKVLVNANTKVDKLSIVDSGQIEISKEATLDSNRLFLQANKNLSNQGKITGKSTRVLSKGNIINDGEINSNDVFVSGKNLINKGKIDSTLSTTVKGRNLQNYGAITSKNYVDLTAGTGFNKGEVTSKNVKATLDNYQNEGVLSAKDNLAIYSNDKLVNKKEISGNVVQISGDYIENTDGAFISAKDGLKIEGKILRNDSSAIVSDKQLYIDAQDEIQNVNEALIHSNGAGTIRSKKILNVASQISSKENLRLQANELENTGKFNYELKNEGYNKLTKHTNVRESMWKAWYNGYTVEVKIPKESVNIDNISSLIHSDKNVVISAYDNGKDKKTKVYNRDSSIVAKESAYIFGDLNNLTTTKTRQLANMLHNVEITLTWDTNSLVNGGIFNSGKDAENVSLLRLLTEKNTLRRYQYWNLLKSINDPGLDKLMSLALGSDWKAKDDIPDLINGKEIEYYSANSRGQVLAQKNIFVKGDVYNDSISTDETLLSWEKNRDTKDKKGIYEKAGEISAGNDKYPKFIYSKDAQESLKKIEKNAKQEDTLGKIKAGNNLIVDAQKFNNKNSQIFAGNNLITLSEDFTNEGSKNIKTDIVAKGQANIKAKENVKLELSEIIADQGLDIQAKNIDLLGADLYSMGGDINLEAEEKVNVEDRIEKDSEKIIENERTTTTNETTELTRETESSKASSIKGKNVNISAGDKAKVKGSDIKAEEKAKIKAKEVDIESSETKDIEKIINQSGGKYKLGLPELAAFKSKSTEQTTQNASTIKANNVVVEAENDINVKGSDIIAKGNVDLKAGGKVNVEDAKETEKTKEGALSIGLVGSTYYNKKEEKGKSRASNIIAGGKVNIDGEEDVDITGSNIKGSGGDIVSRKKKVNFNAVEETHKVTETETSVGFVGSASAGIGDLGAKAEFDSAHNKASTEIINNYAPKKDRGNKQARSKLSSLASGEIGLKISNNKTEIEDKKWKNGTLEASEGSFNIKGKEQVDIGGTDITTKKRLDITAGKVESKVYKDTHKEKTTGFSLTAKQSVGATSSILDAVNSSKEITEDAMKGQLNGGLAALKAAGAVTNLLFNDTVGSNSKQELGFNYTDSNKEVTKDKKSRIKAGEGISITATEEDVNLNNVDIESKGDVDLTAKRDVNVAGGEINEKSTNNNFSAEIHTQQTAGVSAIFGSNVQAGGGASFDYERGSEESTKHTNSKIKGKNVRINAGRDVNVKGAEIRADKKAKVKAERDLNVETPVDTYNTSKIKANASATLSAGLGSNTIGAGNVSASAGGGYIYGNGEKISQRSSITAGEEFEAEVGNNLNLDSATIGSDTKKGSLKVEGETKITERVLKEQAGGAIVGISGGITGELGLDLEIGDKKDKQVAQNSVISLAKENISSGKIKLNGEEVKADSLKTDKKEESKTLKDVFEKGGSASLSFSVKDTKELLGKVRPRSKRSTQESGQKSSGDYEDISGAFSGRNEAESKRAQERIDDSSREARQEPIYAQIDPSKKTPKVESETEKQARIAQENTQKYGPKESVVSPDNATYMTIQRKGRVEEAANKAQRELPKLPGEDVKTQKSSDVENAREKIYEDLDSVVTRKNEIETIKSKESDYEDLDVIRNEVESKKIQESDYEDLDKFRETLSSNRERIENSLREARQEPIYAQIDPSKKTPKVESETEKQARIAQENTQKYGPKESVVSPDNATYMTIQRKGRVEEVANKAQRELPKLPGEDVKTQKSSDVETTKEKIYEDPYSIISNKNDVDNKRVKESDYEDLDVLRNELKNINYKMADDVDFGAFKGEAEGKKYKTDDLDFDKSNKFEEISLADEEKAPIANKPKSEYHGLIEGAGSGVTKDNVFNEKYVTINDKIVAITNTNYTPRQLSAEERNKKFDEVKKKAEKLNPHKEAVDKLKKIANDANDIPKEAIISKLNELRDGYSNEQVMELVNKSAQENSKIVAPDTFDPNKLTPSERSEIGKVFNKTPLSNEYNDFRKNVDQKIYEKLKENPKFVELMNSNLSGNQEKLKELFKIVSESKRDAFKEVGGIDIPTPNLELLSSSKKHKHIHGDYSGDLVRMNDVAPIPSKEKSAQNKELLNTIIHELTHHDQAYLAENRNNANLRQDLKLDADMFSLNQNLYVHKGKDYKKQPLESDAFNAGDSLSDRLMKDVYKDNSS
ncbi:hemagglutinin repeat-containing protein, partial [Campylobacter pinnipediorum]|uniref:hemagglutinin repeat-containing protein n=1 Tax=Campylobacter pinnipediorum TaxID=1965231 RepID=UPI00084DE367